jgi:hypothetical protein
MSKRNYRNEYDAYHGKPEQIKKRAERTKARRMLEKEGVVRKGDGKDVDHVTPLSKGGTSARSNLRVKDRSDNRSFARTSTGAMKSRGLRKP